MKFSHEAALLALLEAAIGDVPGAAAFKGQGLQNRFAVPEWKLPHGQHFQFGDLRIETGLVTVVVEAESGGGLTNLVKYWPLLAAGGSAKRFVVAHIFLLGSSGDYMSHRRLWEFVRDRMRDNLEQRGVLWERDWEAKLFTYHTGTEPQGAADFIRSSLLAGDVK